MQGANIDIAPLAESAEQRRKNGETVMLLASEGKLAGFVAVADPIKPGAAEAIAKLHALGLKIVMATGDNATTAKAVASQLGIDEVRAGMRPEEKLALIDELQRQAGSSPWPATASTMRLRLPRPMSVSPWAPAPTSPWRAPA